MSTLKDLLEQQKNIAAQIEALRKENQRAAISEARTLIAEYDLQPEDIFSKSSSKASAAPKKSVEPKYRNPEDGSTWTGRGKAPLWIATAPDRDAYLIKKD